MIYRTAIVGFLVGIMGAILGAALTSPIAATARQPKLRTDVPGRYRMTSSATGLYMNDTATGECWVHAGKVWQRVAAPPK